MSFQFNESITSESDTRPVSTDDKAEQIMASETTVAAETTGESSFVTGISTYFAPNEPQQASVGLSTGLLVEASALQQQSNPPEVGVQSTSSSKLSPQEKSLLQSVRIDTVLSAPIESIKVDYNNATPRDASTNPPSFMSQNVESMAPVLPVTKPPTPTTTTMNIMNDLIDLQRSNRLKPDVNYVYTTTTTTTQQNVIYHTTPQPLQVQTSLPPACAYLSEMELAILRSTHPIELSEIEEITVNGERGIWLNRDEIANWKGQLPIIQYPINEDQSPEIVTKKSRQVLDYTQEIAIRYLRPPTPPMPGDIIINQISGEAFPPAPPIIIRQQPPRPRTPEPIVIREAPPPPPLHIGRKVITISGKRIPPPPRKVIIERLAPIPCKPQSVIVERWLPYTQVKRKVIFNRQQNEKEPIVVKPRNVIVQWEAPQVQIKREFKYLGVIRANPNEYQQRYGPVLVNPKDLPQFVTEIPTPSGLVLAANAKTSQSYELEGDLNALRLIDLDREGLGEYKPYLNNIGVLATSQSFVNNQQPVASRPTPTKLVYSYHAPPPPPKVQYTTSAPVTVPIQSQPSVRSLYDELIIESADAIIQHIFKSIDVNNSGKISVADAQKTFSKLNTSLNRNYSEQDVNTFFNALDANNDQTIDFQEFRKAFLNISS